MIYAVRWSFELTYTIPVAFFSSRRALTRVASCIVLAHFFPTAHGIVNLDTLIDICGLVVRANVIPHNTIWT